MGVLVDRLAQLDEAEPETRLRVEAMVAMSLGWQLFGPFIRSGVGLDDVPDEDLDAAHYRLAKELLLGGGGASEICGATGYLLASSAEVITSAICFGTSLGRNMT